MAGFGYRSPQFSEDAAWLPPWLQPALCDSQGNRSEGAAYFEDITIDRKNTQLFGENTKYAGCQLYLSGDDDTPNGCNSQTALNFCLHLSSDGLSATTSSQLNEVHHAGKDDKKPLLVHELIPENPVVQGETTGQKQAEAGQIAQDVSPVGTLSMSEEIIVKPLKKSDQKNLQIYHANLDGQKFRNPDVMDAIELSIAASEAMAISDIISNSQLESLTAQNILEIVLHVKDLRNTYYLGLETDSASTDEVDESDQLFDLDEHMMEDAYNDVGFAVTQVAESHNKFSCERDASKSASGSVVKHQFFLQSSSLCDINTHISETPCQRDGEAADKDESGTQQPSPADKDEFETEEPYKSSRSFQKYDSSATETKIFYSEPPEQQARPVCASVSSILPDHHDQPIAPIQLAKTPDDTAEIGIDSKGCRGVLMDNFSRKDNTFLRKRMKGLLNWETSYISESNDFMGDNQLEQMQEEKPEEISSSNTPISLYVCTKIKEGPWEGRVSSHDLVQLSNISLVDPICSFVPCSFGSDDAPKIDNCNKKLVGESGQSLNEKVTLLSHQKEGSSFNHLAQVGDNDPSKCLSDLPICEQFKFPTPYSAFVPDLNTAKNTCPTPYSAFVPDLNTAKNTMLPNQQVSLPNITEKISDLLPVERNKNSSVCFEDESVILKYMKKCGEVSEPYADGSKDSHNLTSKDKEAIELSPGLETVCDELVVLNDEHENIFVNIEKRCHQACRLAVNNNDRSAEKFSTLGVTKCCNSSHKRVHFLDTKGVNHNHEPHQKTNRRSKEFSSSYKYQTRKGILKSGMRCIIDRKEMIFYGLEFLLTGFSSSKAKELEALIGQHGGHVLHNVPASRPSLAGRWKVDSAFRKFPIILSPKKMKSTKFLYGCAINTWTLEASWLFDAVQSGSILPPWSYMIRPIQLTPRQLLGAEDELHIESHFLIFKELGVMLYGKVSFYNKFSKIIKHGGGQVFRSLHQLIRSLKDKKNALGVVLVESEADVSRHLKHCVSEYGLQIAPVSWIINSLFSGKLLPLKDCCVPFHRIKAPKFPMDMSQEI